MATDPLALHDDFFAVVDGVRREIAAAGENKPPVPGGYTSPLAPEASDAIMHLIHDGTYGRAAGRIGNDDPELADQ